MTLPPVDSAGRIGQEPTFPFIDNSLGDTILHSLLIHRPEIDVAVAIARLLLLLWLLMVLLLLLDVGRGRGGMWMRRNPVNSANIRIP